MLTYRCYHDGMRYVRTQVQLTAQQLEGLRRRARKRGLSISALLREAVDDAAERDAREEAWARAMSVAGAFSSGTANTSVDHDDVLTEGGRW